VDPDAHEAHAAGEGRLLVQVVREGVRACILPLFVLVERKQGHLTSRMVYRWGQYGRLGRPVVWSGGVAGAGYVHHYLQPVSQSCSLDMHSCISSLLSGPG
jgi:hypothetical protein